eukprot:CAMPEP_0118644972 /NCGR_PEP_ID=MMETSP0785-20121206/7244_1 /TAXON_ID=91992 /ORGANISM="Bolidomonas pacifica, Strain CCMP 1866" /LENGTH=51 /DNA_ID=CAMNT_0006536807 /DNA_START=79 /DNA_END=234 /DNA_ORIENTATION=+
MGQMQDAWDMEPSNLVMAPLRVSSHRAQLVTPLSFFHLPSSQGEHEVPMRV